MALGNTVHYGNHNDLLENEPPHGYDISKLVEMRSGGTLRFHGPSVYPLLYRLEERHLVKRRWVEKPEQRRRRSYSLTAKGRKVLAAQPKSWKDFGASLGRITGIENA